MSEQKLPAPAPQVNSETKPFWDGTAAGKLLLPRCQACQTTIWYPRLFCPACGAREVSWIEASGKGSIYSFTINRRGSGDYRDIPFVLAYVELEEGPRMLTNIVDCDFRVAVGRPEGRARLPRHRQRHGAPSLPASRVAT